MGYFALEYVRPQEYVPVLEHLRPGVFFVLALLGAWLASGDWTVLTTRLIRLYLAFLLVAAITVPMAVNTYWAYQSTRQLGLILVAGILPSATYLAEPGRLGRFMRLWVGIHATTALAALHAGGTGAGSFLEDENDLALSLAMAMPYAFFLARSPRASRLQRLACMAIVIVVAVSVMTTRSRGGFLGLVATALSMWAFTPHRIRNATVLGALVLICMLLVPAGYIDRLTTMHDPDDSTRVDRLYSWARGWEMFTEHPLLGVGVGNYPWRVAEFELKSPDYDPSRQRLHGGRAAHSLYFTLLAELGLIGTTIYALMLLAIWRTVRRVARSAEQGPPASDEMVDLALFARAAASSLIGFLTAGAFISVLYYPHLWYLVGFVVALERSTKSALRGAQEGS